MRYNITGQVLELDIHQAAAILGKSPDMVRHHIRTGHLLARKFSGRWAFRMEDLQRFQNTPRPIGRPRKRKRRVKDAG